MIIKETTTTQRIIPFDLLRVFLILLVVNYHIQTYAHIKPTILSDYTWFAVPIFIILSFYLMSRYFHRKIISGHFLITRLKRFLFPFVVWSAVGFLVRPELLTVRNIIMQLFTGGVVDAPVYYLILLSLFTVVFWVLAKAPEKVRPFFYIGIIILAFWFEYSATNFKYFTDFDPAIKNCYARFVELIKYASLGLLFSYIPKVLKFALLLIAIALLAYIAYLSVANLLPPWGFDYAGFKFFWGSSTVFAIFLLFSLQKNTYPGARFIILLGKYAFGVYLVHYVALELLISVYPSILYVIVAYPLFFTVLFVSFCYCLCVLIDGLSKGKLAFMVQ